MHHELHIVTLRPSAPLHLIARGALWVLVALFSLDTSLRADDGTRRLRRYLQKDSPLSSIEAALGISRGHHRFTGNLSGVASRTPWRSGAGSRSTSISRAIGGSRVGLFGNRLFGAPRSYATGAAFGVRTRPSPRAMFGVSGFGGHSRNFAVPTIRGFNRTEILFPGQPRPNYDRMLGVRWALPPSSFGGKTSRSNRMYGRGFGSGNGSIYGFTSSRRGRADINPVRARTPSAILDRSFGRRTSWFGGRWAFGL